MLETDNPRLKEPSENDAGMTDEGYAAPENGLSVGQRELGGITFS